MRVEPQSPLRAWCLHGPWARRRLSRRAFLEGVGLAGIVAVVARGALSRLGTARAAAPDPAGVGALADREAETLTAFGLVLVPPAVATPADIRAALDEQREEAPRLVGEFRAGARFLDACSTTAHGHVFTALDPVTRAELVERLLRPYAARSLFSNPYYYLTEHGRRVRRLWWNVAKPILVGFYNGAGGWRVVDYERRPGQCSNLVDYQFPPG